MIRSPFSIRARKTFFLLMLLVVLCAAVAAQAEEAESLYVTIGSSRIYENDTAAARQNAIRDAQQKAVEIAAVATVSSDVLVYYFDKIAPLIVTSPDRYIGNFKVLAENQAGAEYRVVMENRVMTETLQNTFRDAGIQVGGQKMPAVALFLAEQTDPDVPPRYWWGKGMRNDLSISEAALVEILQGRGFRVAEHSRAVQQKAQWELNDAPDAESADAVRFAAQLAADIVVLGRAGASPAANTLGEEIRSFQAEVTLTAYRTDTGEEIARIQRDAMAADADERIGLRKALDQAGKAAGAAMAHEISEKWKTAESGPGKITVQVGGTQHFASYIRFRRELMELPGVKDMTVVERTPDNATLAVSFDGGGRALAGILVLRQFEDFRLDIQEVEADRISVTLIPATVAGGPSDTNGAVEAIPPAE